MRARERVTRGEIKRTKASSWRAAGAVVVDRARMSLARWMERANDIVSISAIMSLARSAREVVAGYPPSRGR